MANMTVKDIPEDVYRALRETAARRGRSLNSLVLEVLRDTAELEARRRHMRESREAFRRFRGTLPYVGDSTELIREDREER